MARNRRHPPTQEEIRERARLEARTKIQKWLADGDTIVCVFECKALDSVHMGTRFALPFRKADDRELVIGKTRGPDTPAFGPGWKFVLEVKTSDVDQVMAAVYDHELNAMAGEAQPVAEGA